MSSAASVHTETGCRWVHETGAAPVKSVYCRSACCLSPFFASHFLPAIPFINQCFKRRGPSVKKLDRKRSIRGRGGYSTEVIHSACQEQFERKGLKVAQV